MADLRCPLPPSPRQKIISPAVISPHAVIEPFVEFDSLARPQAPNLVFDLFEGHDDFSIRSTSGADYTSNKNLHTGRLRIKKSARGLTAPPIHERRLCGVFAQG